MTEKTAPNPFAETLQLPRTDFAMRANLPQREPGWVQRWLEEDVYGQLRAKRRAEGAASYVVHLGPPYANGNFHMGHVLTYVLKDFVVRSKFMAGYDSPYVPGWDCHGLPIEWKIEQELRQEGKTKHDLTTAELRARCRAYADQWIAVQKAEWQRFGALGDWQRPYKTMDAANEAGIVHCLGQLVQRGMVTRQLRSTQWSWAEETALAEAEVEYKDVTSTAVHVALPLVGRDNEFLVIWTTTPWTLPANRAVAVAQDKTYSLMDVREGLHSGKKLWVASDLSEAVVAAIGGRAVRLQSVMGQELVGWQYHHPLYPEQTGQVYHGDHVTTDSGTGLVHIAPAHGQEDFALGKEHRLDLRCPVDGAGKYEADVPALPLTGEALAGKLIWPAQKLILAELEASGRLLHKAEFQHSYPVSWRSKEKLIFRTTPQWFISLDEVPVPETGKSIRESALDRIHARNGVRGVEWVPGYGANRIGSMIEHRPDWCISRQRAWGVPITIMVDKATDKPVADPAVWAHVEALVTAEGIDAWDNRLGGREAELFPVGWLQHHGKTAADFAYVTDILDVWFDSGTTWHHVVNAESGPGQRFERHGHSQPWPARPADLYQEGSDQHRGWFHSSLLTSVALTGDAPYESVVTSGFVVDGEGRKFSKSLGNGVEPRQLLDTYGMDIIRLWVASADYSEDIRYSPAAMESTAELYRRFRNTFRWLLGNLNGFDEATQMVAYDQLPELEQYVLHTLAGVLAEVRAGYDTFQFHRATRALAEFCGGTLSNFYFDVRKDVLYCDAPDSAERRAVQSVLVHLLRALATHLAPLMPFTTDEVWRLRYGRCVHLDRFEEVPEGWWQMSSQKWGRYLAIRDDVNVALEKLRSEGKIGANADAAVKLGIDFSQEVGGMSLEACRRDNLAMIFGVSDVQIEGREGERLTIEAAKHSGQKCPRCWRYYPALTAAGVCGRCEGALAAQKKAVV